MDKFVDLILAWLDEDESVNGLRLRLEMLKRIFTCVVTSYGREEIIEALAEKEETDA